MGLAMNAVINVQELVLEAEQGANQLAELQKDCMQLLTADCAVHINAQQVVEIDTTALQLLVAFCNDVRGGGHEIVWQKPSKDLYDAVTTIAVQEIFEIDESALVDAQELDEETIGADEVIFLQPQDKSNDEDQPAAEQSNSDDSVGGEDLCPVF